jgi:hypothetical protein
VNFETREGHLVNYIRGKKEFDTSVNPEEEKAYIRSIKKESFKNLDRNPGIFDQSRLSPEELIYFEKEDIPLPKEYINKLKRDKEKKKEQEQRKAQEAKYRKRRTELESDEEAAEPSPPVKRSKVTKTQVKPELDRKPAAKKAGPEEPICLSSDEEEEETKSSESPPAKEQEKPGNSEKQVTEEELRAKRIQRFAKTTTEAKDPKQRAFWEGLEESGLTHKEWANKKSREAVESPEPVKEKGPEKDPGAFRNKIAKFCGKYNEQVKKQAAEKEEYEKYKQARKKLQVESPGSTEEEGKKSDSTEEKESE